MKPKEVIDSCWEVPYNLEALSKFFPKIKNKKDLEYFIHCLEGTTQRVKYALKLLEN